MKFWFSKIKYIFSAIMLVTIGFWVNPAKAFAINYSTVTWAKPGAEFTVKHGGLLFTCSVGFPAMDAAGNRYFLSSTGCFKNSNGIPYPLNSDETRIYDSNVDKNIGYLVDYMTVSHKGVPGYDGALVKLYDGRSLVGGWNHVQITPENPFVGENACILNESQDKPSCGKVAMVNYPVSVSYYDYKIIINYIDVYSNPNDPGGAVSSSTGSLGIVSGVSDSTYRYTSFTSITVLLNNFSRDFPGLHLV